MTPEQQKLCKEFMPLAESIARGYKPKDEDLLSSAYLGLCKAAERYTESLGVGFQAFATPWIKGEILMAMRKDRSGPDLDYYGDDMDLFYDEQSDAELIMLQTEGREADSLRIKAAISNLTEPQRTVLTCLYLDEPPVSKVDIAEQLGITKQAVGHIEQRGLAALRKDLG
jgi:RNA polymerase sigma factor (sigma-70 family)